MEYKKYGTTVIMIHGMFRFRFRFRSPCLYTYIYIYIYIYLLSTPSLLVYREGETTKQNKTKQKK
jgi:hypothetical protein